MLNSHLPPPLRKEVLVYIRSCEDFSASAAAHNASFSSEEQDVIEYYTAEVTKTLTPPGECVPNLRQAILEYIRAGEDLLTTPELSEEEQEALEGMVARLYARLQPRKRKSNGNGTERHP